MPTLTQEKPSQEKPSKVSSQEIENNAVLAFLHLEFDQEGLIIQIKPIFPNPLNGEALFQTFRVNRLRKINPDKDHVLYSYKYVDSFFVKVRNNSGVFIIVEKD